MDTDRHVRLFRNGRNQALRIPRELDLLIAAHGLFLGLVVVTDNEREFSRVPGLIVENWLTT